MFWQVKVYPMVCIFLVYLLPLVIILGCYIFIMVTIQKQYHLMGKLTYHLQSPKPTMNIKWIGKPIHIVIVYLGQLPFIINPRLLQYNGVTLNKILSVLEKTDFSDKNNEFHQYLEPNKEFLSHSKKAFLSRAKFKSLLVSSSIIIMYLTSRTPYWVVYFLKLVGIVGSSINPDIDELSHWLFCLSITNSALNPIVYGYFSNIWFLTPRIRKYQKPKFIFQITWKTKYYKSKKQYNPDVSLLFVKNHCGPNRQTQRFSF